MQHPIAEGEERIQVAAHLIPEGEEMVQVCDVLGGKEGTSMVFRAASRWAVERLHRVLLSSSSSTSRPTLLSLATSPSSTALPLPFLSCQSQPHSAPIIAHLLFTSTHRHKRWCPQILQRIQPGMALGQGHQKELCFKLNTAIPSVLDAYLHLN
jgi:hypothetical protein